MRFHAERLVLAHLWVAFGVFGVAAVLGAWQMLVRSPLPAPFASPETYFASVTAHGTLMAYVLTTLFAMGFARIVAQSADSPAEWRTNLPKSCATYGVDCRTSPDRVAWRP